MSSTPHQQLAAFVAETDRIYTACREQIRARKHLQRGNPFGEIMLHYEANNLDGVKALLTELESAPQRADADVTRGMYAKIFRGLQQFVNETPAKIKLMQDWERGLNFNTDAWNVHDWNGARPTEVMQACADRIEGFLQNAELKQKLTAQPVAAR